MKKTIYLDHAAATPINAKVKKIMDKAQTEFWANASSAHTLGVKSKQALEQSRKDIARTLGVKPTEITFTSGTTEAANMVIFGIARQYPNARVVASAIEHEAVREPLVALEREGRFIGEIPVVSSGMVDPESVIAAVDDMTALVCVMYVNNEIGTIQPVAKIAKKISDINADRIKRGITMPLYLFCDAAQAGYLSLAVSRLGVDFLSMGGSKLYGPGGIGFLYVRSGVRLQPLIYGGHQESGLRSGTPNVPAAIGLAAALQLMQQNRAQEDRRQAGLRDDLWNIVKKELPEAKVNGSTKFRVGMNLNILIPGVKGDDLAAYMNTQGIHIATGSACAEANEEPSHVLRAIGLNPVQAQSSIRITLGVGTTKADIVACAKALVKSVEKLKAQKK